MNDILQECTKTCTIKTKVGNFEIKIRKAIRVRKTRCNKSDQYYQRPYNDVL